MLNITEEMQRFLITTTFGYDLKANDSSYVKLKKACSRRAYLDLARVVAYKYSVSQINECRKKKEKEQEIEDFENAKGDFIKKNEEHLIHSKGFKHSREIINNVYDVATEYRYSVFNDSFTYGMAQKWVNMYFKYLWLFSDTEKLAFELGVPEDLDMPIDSYIIDALFEEGILSEEICSDDVRLNLLIKTKNKKIRTDKRPSESILKWSGWDEKIYTAVQELIQKRCKAEEKHILEYEDELWMKKAIINESKSI